MSSITYSLVVAAAVAAAMCMTGVQADTVQMPVHGSGANASIHTPTRGMTMAQVLKDFGKPAKEHAPVGGQTPQQPPITRWDYPGFSVFFEYKLVIDSVIPGHPPKVYHEGSLQRAS